jgi:hypothetical protein
MNYQAVSRASAAAMGWLLASVLFAIVTLAVKLALPVPAIDAGRAAERGKALNELHAAEDKSLGAPGWTDQSRGIVRLPIDTAMQKAAQAWQNPAAARADLAAREKKATAPLPAPPAKANPFE